MDITSGIYLLKGKTLVLENKEYYISEIRYGMNGVIYIRLVDEHSNRKFNIEMNPKQFKALAKNGEVMDCYIKELINEDNKRKRRRNSNKRSSEE